METTADIYKRRVVIGRIQEPCLTAHSFERRGGRQEGCVSVSAHRGHDLQGVHLILRWLSEVWTLLADKAGMTLNDAASPVSKTRSRLLHIVWITALIFSVATADGAPTEYGTSDLTSTPTASAS